jgi:hypothetical protein
MSSTLYFFEKNSSLFYSSMVLRYVIQFGIIMPKFPVGMTLKISVKQPL